MIILLITTIAAIVLGTFVFKVLWVVRLGSLAHWSYLIGCALSPSNASRGIILTSTLFGFMALGNLLPEFVLPRLKLASTVMGIPAQGHMLFLLNRQIARRVDNDTVTKYVRLYTALTLASTMWTIFTLIWVYQSNRRHRNLRRLESIRVQELQNEDLPQLENFYPSIYT